MSEAVPHLEEGLARLAAIAGDPRRTPRTTTKNAEEPREVPRPILRQGGRSFPEDAGQKLPPSLSLVRDGPRAPRERGNVRRAAARPVGPQDRTDEHLDELLRPLCELAQRASLVGVTDRAGLRRALAPYEDGQVRYAVRQTVTMARAGLVKSPVGWLISKAHRADEEFFPPASSIRAIVPAPVAAEPEGTGPEADPEAEAVVSAWEATPGPTSTSWTASTSSSGGPPLPACRGTCSGTLFGCTPLGCCTGAPNTPLPYRPRRTARERRCNFSPRSALGPPERPGCRRVGAWSSAAFPLGPLRSHRNRLGR